MSQRENSLNLINCSFQKLSILKFSEQEMKDLYLEIFKYVFQGLPDSWLHLFLLDIEEPHYEYLLHFTSKYVAVCYI